MGYESALQRVGELRALTGDAPVGTATGAAAAPEGAFEAQLAQQQAMLTMSGGSSDPAAMAAAAKESPLSEFGLPVLSVADQYRMMGLPVPTAGLPGGFSPFGGGAVGQRMVQLAQQELGVSETGGNNESSRIKEYRSATAGAENTPGPWCAYFVSWLAKSAGAPIGAGGNGTGYVPTLEAWGKQENRFVEHGQGAPAPGDIVIFDWGGAGTADHTGIVESVDANGTVHTIEGNASDTVLRREYSASTDDIKGYVRVG
ncbi:MAG: hypothetical protein JWL76_116 [Thermoleophilia bacterium]|nr:hypothetical protein [Thermoleophilia bacterium]